MITSFCTLFVVFLQSTLVGFVREAKPVELKSATRAYVATPDDDGRFVLMDVADGEYTWNGRRLVFEGRGIYRLTDETFDRLDSYRSIDVERFPTSGHIWTLLENFDVSTVANTFDTGGSETGKPALLGSQAGSWTFTEYRLNGIDVTDPQEPGRPLIYPDVRALESVRFSTRDALGTRVLLVPLKPRSPVHASGQAGLSGDWLWDAHGDVSAPYFSGSYSHQRYTLDETRSLNSGFVRTDYRSFHGLWFLQNIRRPGERDRNHLGQFGYSRERYSVRLGWARLLPTTREILSRRRSVSLVLDAAHRKSMHVLRPILEYRHGLSSNRPGGRHRLDRWRAALTDDWFVSRKSAVIPGVEVERMLDWTTLSPRIGLRYADLGFSYARRYFPVGTTIRGLWNPGVKRPYSDDWQLSYAGPLEVYAYHRRQRRRLETFNLAQGYTSRLHQDPGDDLAFGTRDDLTFVVFERIPGDSDKLVLVNPDGLDGFSQGFEITATRNFARGFVRAAFAAMRGKAKTNPGNTELENDINVIGRLFDDPNTLINAEGRTFFDRAYTARIYSYWNAPQGIRIGVIGKYLDGLPFARKVRIQTAQGPIGFMARPRGLLRTQFHGTLDVRVAKSFASGRLDVWLDLFNVLDLRRNLREFDETAPEFPLRNPTLVQRPFVGRFAVRFRM